MSDLADRIEARIRNIGATNHGYVSFMQESLRQLLSQQLIRKIAEEAATEAERPNSLWAKGYAAGKASLRGELDWHRNEVKRLTAEKRS